MIRNFNELEETLTDIKSKLLYTYNFKKYGGDTYLAIKETLKTLNDKSPEEVTSELAEAYCYSKNVRNNKS
jgi:hypothetical protein